VHYSFVVVSDIHGPDKTLVNHFNHLWEAGNIRVFKKCAFVNVSKRSSLLIISLNSDWGLFRFGSVQGGFGFFCSYNAIWKIGEIAEVLKVVWLPLLILIVFILLLLPLLLTPL